MLEDIKDEPLIIKTLSKTYIPLDKPVQNINISGNLSKIYIVASGSSRNAGNITRYFIESVSQIPATVEHASEFALREPVLSSDDLVIFVSQSGETSDVLSALQVAKSKSAKTFAITNNETSTIHTSAVSVIFIHADKKISIPATKSFIAQLICLYIVGIHLAEQNNTISEEKICYYKEQIHSLPQKIEKLIQKTEEIDEIAEKLYKTKSLIVLGRGQNFGLAEEGALKIKETCYINVNGYPTGEFLHGHLAILDENTPVISIITKYGQHENNYQLSVKNTIQLIKKRNAKVFVIKDKTDSSLANQFGEYKCEFLNVSEFNEEFSPVYSGIVLHLLANKMAELLGNDVNNPRSLSKTVSAE
jgi:glutamine---fructose-6-phosphate transaminase (isomerizing)